MNVIEHGGKVYKIKPDDGIDGCKGCAAEYNNDLCCAFMDQYDCGDYDTIFVEIESPVAVPVSDTTKDTNPKDAIGVTKAPLSVIPTQVIYEVGVGMLEGSLKYGRHNYRAAGVRASVYYDATQRHLNSWWEGEDIDPDSGLSHITKAICSLMVLRDAMINDMWNDDRPPVPKNADWMLKLNDKVKTLLAKYPDPVPAYTKVSVK